ncbi:MAG: heterodisulfide reductase-related iron-sulfur binding cluster [Ktedonobacteraceae bacterium]
MTWASSLSFILASGPIGPGRPIFEFFTPIMEVTFYVLAAISTLVFALGVFLKVRKYWRGKPEMRLDHLPRRLGRAIRLAAQNATVAKRDRYAGVGHFMIMWGFITLFLGTVILALDYDLIRPIHPQWQFYHGDFYDIYKLVLDTLGIVFLIGLLAMMIRRGFFRLPQLNYKRVDRPEGSYDRRPYKAGDAIFVGGLFLIGFTGYLLEGSRIAHDQPLSMVWSPVGSIVSQLFLKIGFTPPQLVISRVTLWWVHVSLALIFVAYVPFSKGVHILADFVNLTFRDEQAGVALPPIAEEPTSAHPGYREIRDFTWKHLLDLDSCTKCGRCHEACPARAAGAPLSPRDLILDLRDHADEQLSFKALMSQRMLPVLPADHRGNGLNGSSTNLKLVAGGVIKAETLWACTTCRACVEACPVGIEHVPIIVEMRRSLLDQGDMDPKLQEALTNLAKYGNSFGLSDRLRAKWTKNLPFKIKDARKEPVDYLWFVGDFASFDQRVQDMTRQVATVFQQVGLDFGILYEGERNSGNDVRRVGEEGLFQMLAEQNMKSLGKATFKTIVTTDPHSLNALRNEYGQLGGNYEVIHYTELLYRLIENGQLKFDRTLGYHVTYHDPCYLGRYNRVYDAPRKILEALGLHVTEMGRCRENSFCCGAGGGRIWMTETNIQERPSENRIREAVALGTVDYFVVACPKDVTMYQDAVKTSGYEGQIAVKDIIELVHEALAAQTAAAASSRTAEEM